MPQPGGAQGTGGHCQRLKYFWCVHEPWLLHAAAGWLPQLAPAALPAALVQVMLSMGLGAPAAALKQPALPAARRPPRRRDPAAERAPQALRRSSRHRGGTEAARDSSVLGGQLSAQQLEEEPAPEQELQYDDSSVRQYVCEVLAAPPTATDASGGGRVGVFEAAPPGTQVSGFRRLSGCLHDPALARAYSVDWRPGLVAVSEGAGWGGGYEVWCGALCRIRSLLGALAQRPGRVPRLSQQPRGSRPVPNPRTTGRGQGRRGERAGQR